MSVNIYDKDAGTLTALASGQRTWVGTQAAYKAAKQAGTLPNNILIAITDDENSRNSDVVDLKNYIDTTNCSWNMYGGGKAFKKDNVLYITFANLHINASTTWTRLFNLQSITELGDITHPIVDGSVYGSASSYDQTGKTISLTYSAPGSISTYFPMAIDCSGYMTIPLEEEALI